MKILHLLFFVLFYLTVAANILVAQVPPGTITGNIADDRGPVVNAKISVKLKTSVDYNSIQTVFTDQNGNFTVTYLREGTYDVKTESSCMSSRNENVQVLSKNPVTLNVKLTNEDCNKKAAEEEFEWKSCEQETSVAGLQISDSDKAEIVNQILEELFKFETSFPGYNENGLIMSTENIDPAWIKSFPNQKLIFLSPQKIQAKANKDGDFGYLSFSSWRPGNNCAFIGLSIETAVNKNKAVNKDPVVYYCSTGTQMAFLFRKDSGTWKMKQSKRG